MRIEVCCGSVEDALIAETGGADQIEFTTSMSLGGLTPSYGMFHLLKERTQIPAMVMVRPRESGYYYSQLEREVMLRDARYFVEHGAEGIVFGFLQADGRIDEEACKQMMEVIGPAQAVFHRAFDLVPDPYEALEQLIRLGFRRILTKGQKNTLEEGQALMDQLRIQAKGRIEFISGGVREHNLWWLKEIVKPEQVHIGAFTLQEDPTMSNHPQIFFGTEGKNAETHYQTVDREKLQRIINILRA